jgi:formylglycine-generating enzyme required for sulfatase activity
VGVTWYEAAAFCNWLNDQFQFSPFDVAQGKGFRYHVYDPETREIRSDENLKSQIANRKLAIRLPTEAEWERAARGALPSPDGRGGGGEGYRYPWKSDEITPDHANYADTNLNATSAVGAFPKGMNDYGLLDMSGNVWEWCATEWQDNYKEYLAKENNDLNGDLARVLRGGAYYNVGRTLRCAGRFRFIPSYRDASIGFRVVVRVVSPISP